MRTTTGSAMRWLVLVMVMAAGACSSEPLPGETTTPGAGGSAGAADAGVGVGTGGAGGAASSTSDAGSSIPGLVGRWCSASLGELDLNADGTYAHTPPNSETQTGTWRIDEPMYLTFVWSGGIASATVQVTDSTLTMFGGSGKLVYTRCP